MSNDLLPNGKSALPPRAGIGLLTLELRALLQEESAAAAAVPPLDQLRTRLEPLVDQRRVELDAELEQAKAASAAAVVAARRAASVIVAQAASPANGFELSVERKVPAAQPIAPVAAPSWSAPVPTLPVVDVVTAPETVVPTVPVVEVVTAPETVVPTAPVVEVVTAPETAPAPEVAAAVHDTGQLPGSSEPLTVTAPAAGTEVVQSTSNPGTSVVVDAQAFATVFATVLGTMLDERFNNLGPRMPVVQAPVVAPTPVKQGFWTHAKHPDVILLALTTAIVLVVLAAWLA